MSSRPTSGGSTLYPNWAENTANLPSTGQTNKIAPPTAHTTTGIDYTEPLTAEEYNYQLNLINKWIKYFDTPVNKPNVTIYTSPAASTTVVGYSALTISLTAAMSGDAYSFPTGVITKTGSQANGTASGGTAWSAGNNNPGWISGTSIASNTWYSIYAVRTSSGGLDAAFAALNTTPSSVVTALGSSVTQAVWIGTFYRVGSVLSTIQKTPNNTWIYPMYMYNGIPYPHPFSIDIYSYLFAAWTSIQERNDDLTVSSPVSGATNGVPVKLEYNFGMRVYAEYEAAAGATADNVIGIITANQTTTSTSTDNMDLAAWTLTQNEWQIYAGSPSAFAAKEVSSPTMRILSGQSLRVILRFETVGYASISMQSWRILDYDDTVRGFLV